VIGNWDWLRKSLDSFIKFMCFPDTRNQKEHKGTLPHYKQRYFLAKGAHLTLVCPE
jgi:hypothetical protein